MQAGDPMETAHPTRDADPAPTLDLDGVHGRDAGAHEQAELERAVDAYEMIMEEYPLAAEEFGGALLYDLLDPSFRLDVYDTMESGEGDRYMLDEVEEMLELGESIEGFEPAKDPVYHGVLSAAEKAKLVVPADDRGFSYRPGPGGAAIGALGLALAGGAVAEELVDLLDANLPDNIAPVQTAAAHTEHKNTESSYKITDDGVLTGYGGPVVNPVTGNHTQNPVTGENVFVPTADASVETGPNNANHTHVGNAVEYSIYVDGTSDSGDDISRIAADVTYENKNLNPTAIGPSVYPADLDMYLYAPNGSIIDSTTGSDAGGLGFTEDDLSEGSYTVLLVARHGAGMYDTDITVTDRLSG